MSLPKDRKNSLEILLHACIPIHFIHIPNRTILRYRLQPFSVVSLHRRHVSIRTRLSALHDMSVGKLAVPNLEAAYLAESGHQQVRNGTLSADTSISPGSAEDLQFRHRALGCFEFADMGFI
jgi:hypothetical protein